MSAETNSQERFVVTLAFFTGLALFAWLFFGPVRNAPDTVPHDSAKRTTRKPVFPVTEPDWEVQDAKIESTRFSKIEKHLSNLDEDLELQANRLAAEQSWLALPAQTSVEDDPSFQALKLSFDEQAEALAKISASLEEKNHQLQTLQQRVTQIETALPQPVEPDPTLLERIRLLELRLSKLRRDTAQSRLFVDAGENLGGKASALFGRLRALKEATPQEVSDEYVKIDSELRAHTLLRVRYDSAENEVPEKDRESLEQLVDHAPDGSYFLVAGYADVTGEPEANRILSSKRASNVAELLDRRLRNNQTVRAVYLGQTARFGGDEENRVVEIWFIQP